MHPMGLLGDVGHVESRFGPFEDGVSDSARKVHDLCQTYHRLSDEDINTDHTSTPSTSTPAGPITRARARTLNHQVSSFLSSCPSDLDLGDMCTLVLIRNQGEDRKGKGLA
jgi:hypothetical protein